MSAAPSSPGLLDLSRSFLPQALCAEGQTTGKGLDDEDGRRLNQIRAASYLHLFDLFEDALSSAAREHAAADVDAKELLAPLLRLDAFDHHELFAQFESAFERVFPVAPKLAERPASLEATLAHASPLAILVLALHLKLVTQQHYLACVRGSELLEPHFVRTLKDHWNVECGPQHSAGRGSVLDIQQALGRALPGRVPAALRDYRLLVFACDDVLNIQASFDLETLEAARGKPLADVERAMTLSGEIAAHRKTFLTVGIVNAAFVYAMRSLGPTAPATLAGIVSALSLR